FQRRVPLPHAVADRLAEHLGQLAADAGDVLHDEVVVLQVCLRYTNTDNRLWQQLARFDPARQLTANGEQHSETGTNAAVVQLQASLPVLLREVQARRKRQIDGECGATRLVMLHLAQVEDELLLKIAGGNADVPPGAVVLGAALDLGSQRSRLPAPLHAA